ncbi:MAG: OmpA family protein [Bacteroidota bacterium]
MKFSVVCLFTAIFLIAGTTAHAQKQPLPSNIGAKVLILNHGYPNSMDSLRFTNGIEAFFSKHITPRLSFGIPFKLGVSHLPETRNNTNFISLDALLQFHFSDYDAAVSPYLFAGGGVVVENFEENNIQIPGGLGVHLRLAPNSFLNLQAEYRYGLTKDFRDNVQLGIGYTYRLGKTKMDEDGDGVPDDIDQCPTEIGTKDLAGCPDSDGDGITDIADACPNLYGPESMLGCPDSDEDGIPDSEDKCPDDAGRKVTDGCPDSDEDGWVDAEDECPDLAGAAKGCPDADGDRIPDKDDACPNDKGTLASNGCPSGDSDADGILDENDQCPNEKGSIATKGCPDADEDGIIDSEDRCPNAYGTFNGCPDTDGDGVDDADDECPSRVGIATNNGCPEAKSIEQIEQESDNQLTEREVSAAEKDFMEDIAEEEDAYFERSKVRKEVKIESADQDILANAAQSIQFEIASAVLKSQSYLILKEVAEVLQRYPYLTINIEGHTDDVGRTAANQLLSEQRAKACYEFLLSLGLDSERMSYVGYGELRPLRNNGSKEGRAYNRRVEFKLYE